jgi:hypothetical protein
MAAAAGLTLGGCARSGDVGASVNFPEDRPTAGMITVSMTLRQGPHSPRYIEGAMAEVILRNARGKKVKVQTKEPQGRLTFTHLEPGTYILEPALRPCDGNCGYLDPRVDSCSQQIQVDGRVDVKVDFTVGSRCTIRTD